MKIKGSIALVTGASSGIGAATTQRLAMAGCKVYGTSRRGAQSDRQSFAMLPLDVNNDESVEAAVREVIRREGRIDLLVNNAGFGVAPAAAEESSIEQAKAIFETNFFGLVRMTRDVVLQAAIAVHPKLRYTAGALANRLRLLRRFAPARLVDAGIRKDLRLDSPRAAPSVAMRPEARS